MTNFPALTPSSRRVTQGQFPVKRFASIAGTGTTRAYGSQPVNSLLEMSFDNVPDASALALINCYEAARGNYASLSLPSSVWDGMDSDLAQTLQRDYKWRFADAPQIASGPSGISSVTIRLEGQRDG